MGIVGGGEKNKAAGEAAVVAGGKENGTKEGFAFIGGGEKNKCLSSASSISGGSKNQIKKAAPFSFIGGGFKNKMKGNYATAMGQNALANQNLCMAIGLQAKGNTFARANQVGDWILRAERIDLRVDGTDKVVVLTNKNIKKFRSILKGTHRRRLEARSDEEQNLLTVLEELEDLVEYQEVVIEELVGDIQDFYRDLQEANEDLFKIDSD